MTFRDTEYGATPEEEGAHDYERDRRANAVDSMKTRLRDAIKRLSLTEPVIANSFEEAAQLTSDDLEMYELALMLSVVGLVGHLQGLRSIAVDRLGSGER